LTAAPTKPATSRAAWPARACCPTGRHFRLAGEQAFTLGALARKLARAADGFRLFPGFLFGRLFVMAAKLHLAENAFALHLFLQRLEGLINIIVTNENLHLRSLLSSSARLIIQ
jgi:hypothetical protein